MSIWNDTNISWRAKGIYCYLLDNPDIPSWTLAKMGKEKKTALTTAMKELVDAGYIKTTWNSHKRQILKREFNFVPLHKEVRNKK